MVYPSSRLVSGSGNRLLVKWQRRASAQRTILQRTMVTSLQHAANQQQNQRQYQEHAFPFAALTAAVGYLTLQQQEQQRQRVLKLDNDMAVDNAYESQSTSSEKNDQESESNKASSAVARAAPVSSSPWLPKRLVKHEPEPQSRSSRSQRRQDRQTTSSSGEKEKGFFSIRDNANSQAGFQRRQTIVDLKLHDQAEKGTLESQFKINWRRPLGEGAFGAVYLGVDRQTGEKVAVKKISQRLTSHSSFQNEMGALLQIRAHGGHPHICGMHENFEEDEYYYLVLDLIAGGEMFEHLINQGPYSEADAARLVREVASAMNFLHGLGIVHGDLKPENLMLSSKEQAKAVIKVVDFGCARSENQDDASRSDDEKTGTANTPAYSSPEILAASRDPEAPKKPIEASFDMWAIGVILYIMLTGVHPFDLYGTSTDAEIEDAILSGKKPPLGKSPLCAHLSPDAVNLIDNLLQWDPQKRLTAHQLLEHPWVRGETASKNKIADSDKRLNAWRLYKTKMHAKAFSEMVSASEEMDTKDVSKRTSLIELSFSKFDPDNKGYIRAEELRKLAPDDAHMIRDNEKLNLSGYSDILAEHMKNKYFPKGHVVYKEGEVGNAMYFINSGSIEVTTKDGYRTVRNSGEFFGEGALLNPKKIRSATIKTLTPIHVMEISRDYFEKYMANDSDIKLKLRSKDKDRKRERAKMLLQLQQNMKEVEFKKGDHFFTTGERSNSLFIISEGTAALYTKDGQEIIDVNIGEITGEHSSVFGRPRNVDAICKSDSCKAYELSARDFQRLLARNPGFKDAVRDICLRREFQKALCFKLRHRFPRNEQELKEAFYFVSGGTDSIKLEDMRPMLHEFDPTYVEQDITDILHALDLNESGEITWPEFRRLFGMEKPKEEKKPVATHGTISQKRKKWKRG